MHERITDEVSPINLEIDTIEKANAPVLGLHKEALIEDLPKNERVIIIEDEVEASKNAAAQDAAEKLLNIAKICFSTKKNQDFFIDRLETILQLEDQKQGFLAICEKAYADIAKYLIYQTANKLPNEKQEDFIKLAKALSARYITRDAAKIKGSFERKVLARAEAKLVKEEKASLVRVLQKEYTRINGDLGKFLNDKIKTQNKLNVIQRSINLLSEAGSLNSFKKLAEFTTSLTKNKDLTQSRNRFFTIESDAKKLFEENYGKPSIPYKKK